MSYRAEACKNIAFRILGGGLILAAAGLFAMRFDEGTRGLKVREPRAAATVVNATSSDGFAEAQNPDEASRQQELRNLEKKIKMLEADVAFLKRQHRVPEH